MMMVSPKRADVNVENKPETKRKKLGKTLLWRCSAIRGSESSILNQLFGGQVSNEPHELTCAVKKRVPAELFFKSSGPTLPNGLRPGAFAHNCEHRRSDSAPCTRSE